MSEAPGQQTAEMWWKRNWKWVVPSGCLVLVLGFVVFAGGIFAVVMGAISSSWACTEGLELTRSHPEVVAALGEPIETGWFLTGSVNVSGDTGQADLAIPLRGSVADGTLYVVAEKRGGRWTFEVAVEGRAERIDLLAPWTGKHRI